MKAAEEWYSEFDKRVLIGEHVCVSTNHIKQIQLDAMKEGMRRVAKIADNSINRSGGMECGCERCEQNEFLRDTINNLADQLTEKDL